MGLSAIAGLSCLSQRCSFSESGLDPGLHQIQRTDSDQINQFIKIAADNAGKLQ